MCRLLLLVSLLTSVACEPELPPGTTDEMTALRLAVTTPADLVVEHLTTLRRLYEVERLMRELAPEGVRTGTLTEWDGQWRYAAADDEWLIIESELESDMKIQQYEFEGDVALPFEQFLVSSHEVEINFEGIDVEGFSPPFLLSSFTPENGQRYTAYKKYVAIEEILGSAGFSASSDIETLQRDEVTGALESTSWTNESFTYIHLRGKGGTESFFPIDIDESQAIVVRVGDGLQLSVDRLHESDWYLRSDSHVRDARFRSEYVDGKPVPSEYWRAEGFYVVDEQEVSTFTIATDEDSLSLITEIDGERVELQSIDLEP